jgi:hypothetical protein
MVQCDTNRRTVSYTSSPPPIPTVFQTALTCSFHERLAIKSSQAPPTESAGIIKCCCLQRIKDIRGIRKNNTDAVTILLGVK